MSKVVYRRGTWGTETSKYPQEKKENSIPKVVASEIGREPKPEEEIHLGFGLHN